MRSTRAELLRNVVAHAYHSVPYYRKSMDAAGVAPEHVRGPEDLAALPTVGARDLRDLPESQVLSDRFRPDRLVRQATSSSSGSPLVVRRSWFEQKLLHAYRMRAWRSLGLRPRDLRVRVGIVRTPHPRDNKIVGRVLGSVGQYRQIVLDGFVPADRLLHQLHELAPDVIHGYPTILARLADARRAEPSDRVRPRFLMCGGEALTPVLRRRIEQGFGVPVYDLYGCHELNLVASECPETRELHVCADALVLEVLRDGEPVTEGERGEVFVTGLHSYAMPFVRYPLGDVVTKGRDRCACGAPFSTIRQVEGRTFAYFELPDGGSVHAHQVGLRLVAAAPDAIRQYQLVQERHDRIVALVVPDPESPPDGVALRAALVEILGPGAEVVVELVDEIPCDPNGKTPPYRTSVPSGPR